MSLCMRKPTICLDENKAADQLRGNREANQRLCFRHTDSTIPLLMPYTCLIILDPEIPFTLPEMKGISGTDGANYLVIK